MNEQEIQELALDNAYIEIPFIPSAKAIDALIRSIERGKELINA